MLDELYKRQHHVNHRYIVIDLKKNLNILLNLEDNISEKMFTCKDEFFLTFFESIVERKQNICIEDDAIFLLGDLDDIIFNLLGQNTQVDLLGSFEIISSNITWHKLYIMATFLFDSPEDTVNVFSGMSVGDSLDVDKIVIYFFSLE